MRAKTIATLVIIRKNNSVLLGLKKKGEIGTGKYNAPGGKWEDNENILECAAREVDEEVDVTVRTSDLRHLGSLECYVGQELFQRVHVYYAEKYYGEPRKTASMIPEWISLAAIPFKKMHEGDQFWFPLAARKQKFKIRIWYKKPGEGYIDHEILPYD